MKIKYLILLELLNKISLKQGDKRCEKCLQKEEGIEKGINFVEILLRVVTLVKKSLQVLLN